MGSVHPKTQWILERLLGGPCLGMWAYVRDRQWGVRLPKTLVKEDKLSKPQAMMKRKTGALEWGCIQHQPALLGWRTAPG